MLHKLRLSLCLQAAFSWGISCNCDNWETIVYLATSLKKIVNATLGFGNWSSAGGKCYPFFSSSRSSVLFNREECPSFRRVIGFKQGCSVFFPLRSARKHVRCVDPKCITSSWLRPREVFGLGHLWDSNVVDTFSSFVTFLILSLWDSCLVAIN